MNRIVFALLFCFAATCLFGQEFYMYVGGQKRIFNVSETKKLIKMDLRDTEGIKDVMQQQINTRNLGSIYDLNSRGLFMVDMQSTASSRSFLDAQKQWHSDESVIFTSPVFVDDEGHKLGGLTNQILVRLKSTDDYTLLRRTVANYEVNIKQCEFDKQVYLLTLIGSSAKNAMQIANELSRTGVFEYSEPNLIQFLQPATVNDRHFQYQWGLS